MSDTLLNYLNNILKLSPPITDINKDFSNGYYFAQILYKTKYLKDLKEFDKNATKYFDVKRNYKLLEKYLMPLSIHIDENTQKEIMNNIKGAAAKIIYRIKTQIDRKRINFDEMMERLNVHLNSINKNEQNLYKTMGPQNFKKVNITPNYKIQSSSVGFNKNKIKLDPLINNKTFKKLGSIIIEENINEQNDNLSIKSGKKLTKQSLAPINKYDSSDYCKYYSLDKNMFDLGIDIKQIDPKLKKYGEGENQQFIPTNIVMKKIYNKVNEEKMRIKAEKESHKILTEQERLLKNSILKNKNNDEEDKKIAPKMIPKQSKLYKQFEYEDFRKTHYPLLPKNIFLQNENDKTYYPNNDNEETKSVFSKMKYLTQTQDFNKGDFFDMGSFFKKLNKETVSGRNKEIEIRNKLREEIRGNIMDIFNLMLDISEESYNYQSEYKCDLIDIPEWRSWMQDFINGKSCIKAPKHNRNYLDSEIENYLDKLDEEEKKKILSSEFCISEFLDYLFLRGNWNINFIPKKVFNSELHIYKTLGNDIMHLISSGKMLLQGLKPAAILKMKNEAFELKDSEKENIIIPKKNTKDILFAEIIELNADMKMNEINSVMKFPNSTSLNSLNNINQISKEENKFNDDNSNISNNNISMENEKENEQIGNINSNVSNSINKDNSESKIKNINLTPSDLSYIPIKLCLIGHLFSGRKTQGKLISEKYPNIKIYSVNDMINGYVEEYLKIKKPIENHPKFKSMKKNQIEALEKEKEEQLEKFKDLLPIIEPFAKKEVEKINDDDLINLLLQKIKNDFPYKDENTILEEITNRNNRIKEIEEELNKIAEEQQKKPKAKVKEQQNYQNELEKINKEKYSGFFLIDFPETYEQYIRFEELSTGFIQEIDKEENKRDLNLNRLTFILDKPYHNISSNIANSLNGKKTSSGTFNNYIWLEVNEEETLRRVNNRKIDPNTNIIYHMEDNPPPPNDKKLNERLIDVTEPSNEEVKNKLKDYDIEFPKILSYINLFRNLKKINKINLEEIENEIENIMNDIMNHFEDRENKDWIGDIPKNDLEENESMKYFKKLGECKKKINHSINDKIMNEWENLNEKYSNCIKTFLFEIENQKKNVIEQMNIIQNGFINFLNLPSNKKKLINIFLKKYETFMEKFIVVKKHVLVKEEFAKDLTELTEHFWELIEMKKRDAINERKMIIESGFIENQIEFFYKNLEKIFICETEKFEKTLNLINDFYYQFDPNKIEENNPFIYKIDPEVILKNINECTLYDNDLKSSPKLEKIHLNCFKIFFDYDKKMNEIEIKEKEKAALNTSGSSTMSKKGRRRQKKIQENIKIEPSNISDEKLIINHDEELKNCIENEKIKFKIRVTFLKYFGNKFINELKKIAKITFDTLDEWIIESVKIQNEAMNSVMNQLKTQIDSGEIHLEYDNELDSFEIYKCTDLKFEKINIKYLKDLPNESKIFDISELRKIYLDLKTFEIQPNYVLQYNVIDIIVRKYIFDSKSKGFIPYLTSIPCSYIHQLITKFTKITDKGLKIVRLDYLFDLLALINLNICTKKEEKEMLEKVDSKLLFHCYLSKEDFLSSKLWFENEGSNKQLKDFLYEINQSSDGTVNFIEFLNVVMLREITYNKENLINNINKNDEMSKKIQNYSIRLSKNFDEIDDKEENKALSLKLDDEEENDSLLIFSDKEITYFDILINE